MEGDPVARSYTRSHQAVGQPGGGGVPLSERHGSTADHGVGRLVPKSFGHGMELLGGQ